MTNVHHEDSSMLKFLRFRSLVTFIYLNKVTENIQSNTKLFVNNPLLRILNDQNPIRQNKTTDFSEENEFPS